ncbi:MAG: winged helix-turn-helix domain-containing protein [Nanoarchaeota archaeon]
MINLQTRELVLKWKKEGKKQQQIADLIGCNQSAVSRLVAKFKKTGSVKNLRRSGRPTPLTKKALAKLKVDLTRKVKEANEHYCSIDTKQFSDIIEGTAKRKYSNRHVQRLLHKLDFSRITPRSKHIKNDPEKVRLFREDFKKNSKRSTWVLKL